MKREPGFLVKSAGPTILRWEAEARWARLDPATFRRAALGLAVLAVAGGLLTWSRVRVLANSYQIADLRAERDALQQQNRRLERRFDEVQSLDFAEKVARGQLGMVDVNPNQVVTLRKQGLAGRLADSVADFFGRGGKPGPADARGPKK